MFGKCNDMNTYPENERYHPTHFKQFLVAYEVMGQDLLATLYINIMRERIKFRIKVRQK